MFADRHVGPLPTPASVQAREAGRSRWRRTQLPSRARRLARGCEGLGQACSTGGEITSASDDLSSDPAWLPRHSSFAREDRQPIVELRGASSLLGSLRSSKRSALPLWTTSGRLTEVASPRADHCRLSSALSASPATPLLRLLRRGSQTFAVPLLDPRGKRVPDRNPGRESAPHCPGLERAYCVQHPNRG